MNWSISFDALSQLLARRMCKEDGLDPDAPAAWTLEELEPGEQPDLIVLNWEDYLSRAHEVVLKLGLPRGEAFHCDTVQTFGSGQ